MLPNLWENVYVIIQENFNEVQSNFQKNLQVLENCWTHFEKVLKNFEEI